MFDNHSLGITAETLIGLILVSVFGRSNLPDLFTLHPNALVVLCRLQDD